MRKIMSEIGVIIWKLMIAFSIGLGTSEPAKGSYKKYHRLQLS
jgi:hypothetical protein